jgi:hypothetical protein
MIILHKIGLICLTESRVNENKADRIRSSIVFDWDYAFNYDKHFFGENGICWKKIDYEVTVIDKCEHSITCFIKSVQNRICWLHSLFMGPTKVWKESCFGPINLVSMKARVAHANFVKVSPTQAQQAANREVAENA